MDPGKFDNRATFTERKLKSALAGNVRTDDYAMWLKVWAQFRPVSGSEQASAGVLQDVAQAIIRVRDTKDTRKIIAAHRVKIKGGDWAIKAVMPADRRTGLIEMMIARDKAG